ncbi:MAG: YHYH protein [Candidatus Obscuribacterales bacterium]|nr:YHYH protein [Candidatus Obscuribacterales bacterium]
MTTRVFPLTGALGAQVLFLLAVSVLIATPCCAHYESEAAEPQPVGSPAAQPPNTRKKTALWNPWQLLDLAIPAANAFNEQVSIIISGDYRVIRSNGIPDHPTGHFPNAGNPNVISEQHYEFQAPKEPKQCKIPSRLRNYMFFGVALNGVPFDPGTAEFWKNDPSSGWTYEAMVLGSRLGLDQNNAHVQPNGAYHYHGTPTGLLERLAAFERPVQIGFAADGFPVYGPFGYKNPEDPKSLISKLRSSYRVKSGSRPDKVRGSEGPGGSYDGTFVQDYEYVAGLGDLDECNGRYGVTPEYPKGTYYYVVTDGFPFVPRWFRGVPDQSFSKGPPTGFGRPGGPPGRHPGPGFGPPGEHLEGGRPSHHQPPPPW